MMPANRQPAIFLSHGGGPCFWMDFPPPVGPGGFDGLRNHFAGLLDTLPARPSAIVVITAHWETPAVTVSAACAPTMLFDYYGFPKHTYELTYPAPGAPSLAARIANLLREAGVDHAVDTHRGFDHGVFVPMLIVDPSAQIPVVMVSIRSDFDVAKHIDAGRALAPLRDQGVLILGSGNTWHGSIGPTAASASHAFDDWVTTTLTDVDASRRKAALCQWEHAPHAREAQKREDHLMPLMVVAGAAGGDTAHRSFQGTVGSLSVACYRFG